MVAGWPKVLVAAGGCKCDIEQCIHRHRSCWVTQTRMLLHPELGDTTLVTAVIIHHPSDQGASLACVINDHLRGLH